MKKTLLSLACLVFLVGLSGSVSAQPAVTWAKAFDTGSDNYAYGVAVDSKDNVIVTGDAGTIKYDSNGNELWNVTQPECGVAVDSKYDYGYEFWDVTQSGCGVAVDSNDNIIVTGDRLTIKYDSDGNQLWNRTYCGGVRSDWVPVISRGVVTDSKDNIIVTGQCEYGSDTNKYDSSGNLLWSSSYPPYAPFADIFGAGVAVDSKDNVIVNGFELMIFMEEVWGVMFAEKYDSNLSVIWSVEPLNPWHSSSGLGVATDSEDNVILTGTRTLKYDSDGKQLWGITDSGYGVAVDSNDNIYTVRELNRDYLTTKYDPNGTQLWNTTYDGGDHDSATGVALDSHGNIIVTGFSYLGGNYDYYTIKYRAAPPKITATVDINPDTLNLKSKGKWITAYIELPEGYNVSNINVSSILLNDTISAELSPTKIGDYDSDNISDLMVKFDRANVEELIHVPIEIVQLTLTGAVAGMPFEGSDTIRVKR